MLIEINKVNEAYQRASDEKKRNFGDVIAAYLVAFVRSSEVDSKQNIDLVYQYSLEALENKLSCYSEEGLIRENVAADAVEMLQEEEIKGTPAGFEKTIQYASKAIEFLEGDLEKKT